MKWVNRILIAAAALAAAGPLQATPWYAPEPLPTEGVFRNTGEGSKKKAQILANLVDLEFYRDFEDSTIYYILPVFRSVSKTLAGSHLINVVHLDRIKEIKATLKEIKTTLSDAGKKRNPIVDEIELAISKEQKKTEPNAQLLDRLQKHLDKELTKLASPRELIPEIDYLGSLLAMSRITPERGETLMDKSTRDIYTSRAFSQSAGQLTLNINAKLTKDERKAIADYQKARIEAGLTPLRISTMPFSEMRFHGLNEYGDSNEEKKETAMFRRVDAAGNFLGATVNLDLNSDSAETFHSAPPPVVVPVGVKGSTLIHYPPFTARLKCEFTHSLLVKYKGSVADGAIFNDQTIESFIPEQKDAMGPCKIEMEGGDGDEAKKAARFAALSTLQDELVKDYITQVRLTKEEVKTREEKLRADTQKYTRSGELGNKSPEIDWQVNSGDIHGYRVNGRLKGRNFAWHVNEQNLERLQSFKIDKEITDKTASRHTMALPTQICLAYNPIEKAYFGCSEKEYQASDSLLGAKKTAANSEECKGTKTITDCKEKREEKSPRFNATGNIAPSLEEI